MVLLVVLTILQHLVGILFLHFLLILKVAICVFDGFLPTYFNLFSGNEASQSLLDTQVENLSKGFSFVEEHGLCSTTPRARTNVQNKTSPKPFVKRHSPRLSAQKNVLPKKVAETIVEVVAEVLSSSCDGK